MSGNSSCPSLNRTCEITSRWPGENSAALILATILTSFPNLSGNIGFQRWPWNYSTITGRLPVGPCAQRAQDGVFTLRENAAIDHQAGQLVGAVATRKARVRPVTGPENERVRATG